MTGLYCWYMLPSKHNNCFAMVTRWLKMNSVIGLLLQRQILMSNMDATIVATNSPTIVSYTLVSECIETLQTKLTEELQDRENS